MKILEMNSEILEARSQNLGDLVRKLLQIYLENSEGESRSDLYKKIISEAETPLFESVMKFNGNNQAQSAKMLGIARATLRARLKKMGKFDKK